jgi:hypothetical protein
MAENFFGRLKEELFHDGPTPLSVSEIRHLHVAMTFTRARVPAPRPGHTGGGASTLRPIMPLPASTQRSQPTAVVRGLIRWVRPTGGPQRSRSASDHRGLGGGRAFAVTRHSRGTSRPPW